MISHQLICNKYPSPRYLLSAYVARREGNVFTLSVHQGGEGEGGTGGGYPPWFLVVGRRGVPPDFASSQGEGREGVLLGAVPTTSDMKDTKGHEGHKGHERCKGSKGTEN